jgi:hypothetical protein
MTEAEIYDRDLDRFGAVPPCMMVPVAEVVCTV